MAEPDSRTRLKQWLESGAARLQPLSFPQRELWEASPVPVADWGNHISGFIEIKGALTPGESETAIQRVVDRQEVLRTSFLPGKDRPLQLVRSTGTPLQSYRELSKAEARPEALEETMREVSRKPFDLVQGPLHRVEMMRRAANDHVLAFSIHHAIADGWSLGVFVQDLCTAYVMGLKGLKKAVATSVLKLADKLEPVPQTYSEWSAAERAFWTPAEIERRAGFWKTQLAGSQQVWSRRADVVRNHGALQRHVSALPPALTRAARNLAQRSGATLFSTLLAAFQFTLWKWTGRQDLTVGTPVANRNKPAVRQTMGYFAGVVPLRGHVDPARSFTDHLRDLHANAQDCFAHALPFAELARLLPGKEPHAIFDIRFALQNHPIPDVDLPRISTRLRMRSTGTARFDLGCEITETGSELEIVWLFRHEICDRVAIGELDGMFRAVLAQACQHPENRATTLSV
jgi:hypothetical protein